MKKLVLIVCFFVTIDSIFAQTISLEQVRLLALANSRSLAKVNLSLRSSALDEKAHLFTMLPCVSAAYSASMDYLNKDWDFINPVDTFRAGLNIEITQTIFNGGRSLIQKSINEIATESLRKEAMAEYFNTLDTADNAYFEVLKAAATLEAEESSLQTALSSLAIAEIRQSSGMINPGDYLKALSDRETRENSRNQARRTLSLNMMKLRSITGLTELPTLEAIDISGYEDLILYLGNISDEDADALHDRFWNIFTASNPALARSALSRQRAEKNLSIARRDYVPVIRASVFTTGIEYTAAKGFGTSSGGGVTLRGSIPLDFWVMSNRVEKSKIALQSASLDYMGAEIQLETDLQSALIRIFDQSGYLLSSRRSLEYAEKQFEYVVERYRLLQSSISDLTEASTSLINSRNRHIEAQYGFLQSLSKLRSLGAIDDEERLVRILIGNL